MVRSGFIVAVVVVLGACSGKGESPSEATSASTSNAPPAATAQSTKAAPEQPAASGCLVDQGGCRTEPAALSPCTADVLSVATVALGTVMSDPGAYANKTIALAGPLVKNGAGCTEKACELTCCNTCSSIITLGRMGSDEYIRLESATMPGQYLCRGDESLVCCQIEARGQQVIAQGTFQIAPSTEPPVYQLWVTELCAPAAE